MTALDLGNQLDSQFATTLERAELLEGTFEVLRPGEGGTLVRLDVPLTDTL